MDKKQLLTLIIVASFVAVLPLILLLSRNRLETRSKATGSGEITVSFIPSSAQILRNSSLTVNIDLTNVSSLSKSINVAGVDLSYDPNFFTISNLSCGSILSAAAKNEIISNAVFLSCFTPGGTAAYILDSNATITLGTFDLTAIASAPTNTATSINVTRSSIPDTQTGIDLSSAGTGGEYSIVSSGNCARKTLGDANCDDLVDLVDFEIWRREYTGEINSHRANFNPDTDNQVDLLDFEIWRQAYVG